MGYVVVKLDMLFMCRVIAALEECVIVVMFVLFCGDNGELAQGILLSSLRSVREPGSHLKEVKFFL